MKFQPVSKEVDNSNLLAHISDINLESNAITVGDQALTYGELMNKSSDLAAAFERLGIGKGERVALYMDRSIELVLGIIATLKTEGTYIPLDVNAPSERIEWILRDSTPGLILTISRHLHDLPEFVRNTSGCKVLVLNHSDYGTYDLPSEKTTENSTSIDSLEPDDRVAYIIYTSGSTGNPKGVMVTHTNLIASTRARSAIYDIPPSKGHQVLIPVPFTFDGAMGAFWWTLFNGGTIVLPEPNRATDATSLAQLIKKQGVTHTAILTTLYGLVLDASINGDLESLKVVTVGGEVLPPNLVGAHYKYLPDTQLYNEYGPTECTVWATAYRTRAEDQFGSTVPIGKVANHLKPYILDPSLKEVEVGNVGTLFLGGEGVAAGYINRPDLTQAAFIQSPFNEDERLYNTGDLVKSDRQGNLLYLGRSDDQVKIGGVRIELGEIDKTLLNVDGVFRASTIAREFGGKGSAPKIKQLVAIVQLSSGVQVTVSDIRRALSASLPSAMVPTHILIVDNLPVLSSGKIDRQKLQQLDISNEADAGTFKLPRNAVEQSIWEVWSHYFNTDKFGIRDNFFALGGHSLLAAQLVLRLNNIFRINLSVRELFALPTIAEYANLIHSLQSENTDNNNYQSFLFSSDPIPTLPRDVNSPFSSPASFAQRRMWFAYQYDPRSVSYNLPVAIKFSGNVDVDILSSALREIVKRHEAFRTVYSSVDGNAVQIVQPTLNDAHIDRFDLTSIVGEEIDYNLSKLLQEEAKKPFNIEQGPAYRFALIDIGDRNSSSHSSKDVVLLAVMHHIMSDHWSLSVFLHDLDKLYRIFSETDSNNLISQNSASTQYADFSVWQRNLMESDDLSVQRNFWIDKLADLPVLSLPTDFPRPEQQSLKGSRFTISLPDGLLDTISNRSADLKVTPYMLMLSAFQILMSRYSGQNDFAVGTPVAGRKHPDLEDVIGVFINTLVLRANLDGVATYADVIERVRENVIEAFANEDIPYEQIVEDIGGMRSTSYSPVIQVLFNVQNAPVKLPEIPEIVSSFISIDFDGGATQFDLVFNIDTALGKHLEVAYATDLFREETIGKIVEDYFSLLSQLVSDPYASLPDSIAVENGFQRSENSPASELRLVNSKATSSQHILPRNGIEESLWDIWKAILKHAEFGVRDDFFISGGHSLLATQVVSRIRDILRLEVPLRTFFENPTIERLSNYIDESLKKGNSITQIPSVTRLPRRKGQPLIAPVSFSQRRMWIVQETNPESTAYNMPFSIRLTGKLDRNIFASALEYVIQRHEAFRTTLRLENGEPVQIIDPELPKVEIKYFDFSTAHPTDRKRLAEETLRTEALTPFKLDKGPLYSMTLVKTDEEEHIFLWLLHHVIGDQWSAGTMFHELSVSYNAIKKGETPVFGDMDIEYTDFASWQRQFLGGEFLNSQLEFWRQNLSGIDVLTLPIDKPRPSVQSFRGESVFIPLNDEFIDKLHRWSAARGFTSYMTLLGAFQVVLSRYSNQDNIAVGSPIANRTISESENLVGTLVNTLVMRAELSEDPTFANFMTRVRENTLNAYANQDIPFERLVDELGVSRDTSHAPLVQVLFNVVNAPFNIPPFDGVKPDLFYFDSGSVQFDLNMSIGTDEFKGITLGYSTALFERRTAQRILDSYILFLNQVMSDSEKRVSEYDLIDSRDLGKILYEWNSTNTNYDHSQRVDDLVALNALSRPESIAVSMDNETLTYGDLNREANRLARCLRKRGIEPGKVVGICHDRSPRVVVALLAVMKSGGIYVPLDPDFPRERLALMSENAGFSAIITQDHLLDHIPMNDSSVHLLNLDKMTDEINTESSNALERWGNSQDPAYILFTSGSTGTPKGVAVSHRSLVNFLRSMQTKPGFKPDDVLLSVTTLSFDISALEIYLPLISGGRVEFARKEEIVDGRKLIAKISDKKPTIIQATPATWRMLVDTGWQGSDNLKILCGGEALSADLASSLSQRSSELWNMYGPTETTVWSTVEKIVLPYMGTEDGNEKYKIPQISIGRPIGNTTVYILDRHLKPVPIGVAGELFIGGDGVAIGYYRCQDLTDERFLKNPFSADPKSRIYKTGDLAKWLPDGRIVHLGRLDFQVKIRGFRIELGEIESVIAKHPKVTQVVVAAKEDNQGIPQLVAYVILRPDIEDLAPELLKELRDHVRDVLPAYMVPSHIVLMDNFPLTANNKVNVKALPQPNYNVEDIKVDTYSEPDDTLTLQLLLLWRQVLGTEAVGTNDNFFELGGHSLKAVQLLSHVNNLIGKQLPLSMLFQAPTVDKMVKLLTNDGWEPSWRSLVAINAGGRKLPVFTVPGVGGNVIMFSRFSKILGPETPVYGLQARGLDGKTEPFTSISEMAEHNIQEIKSVHPHGPYVILGVCTGGVIAYEMAHQLRNAGDVPILIMADTWHPTSYRKSIIPEWLVESLRPATFWTGKALGYIGQMLSMSPLKWFEFFRSKLNRAGTIIEEGNVESVLAGGSYYRKKMREATINAIIDYNVRPYNHPFMYVYADEREIGFGKTDTRRIWKTLSPEVVEREIAAIDSGQMFVSPNVEEMCKQVSWFVDEYHHLYENRDRSHIKVL